MSSTIDPNVPATDSDLTSAPIRNNFTAAYNDINGIQTTLSGLGNMSTQSQNNVTITGGTIAANGAGITHLTAANIDAGTAAINISGNAATVTTINGKLAAGTSVTITGSGTSGSPYTISASGGTGTVTSVGLATDGFFVTASGSPITGAGTFTLSDATHPAYTLIGNPSSSIGTPTDIELSGTLVFSGNELHTAALTGDVTTSANSFATSIATGAVTTGKLAANAVTNAKMATGAHNNLAGYDNSGNFSVVSIGSGLSLVSGELSTSGGGGSPGGVQYDVQLNDGAGGFSGSNNLNFQTGYLTINGDSGYGQLQWLNSPLTGGYAGSGINGIDDQIIVGALAGDLSIWASQAINFSSDAGGTNMLQINTDGKINIASLTASQLTATDASKNLQSLTTATYPSLTEISYVKGVTSAIQTQINAKGSGTVTAVSVASANGFAGSSSGGATPALTLSTSITGVLLGNGTAISASSVTNDVQTKAAIVPNTAPSSGQVLVGNAGGTAYAPVTMSGDATIINTGALTVGSNKISYAKMQQASAGTLLGNPTVGTANISEITLGTNLSFSGSVLNASATAATAFSALTGSTNTTAAMVVGTGASLGVSGSGTIAATSVSNATLTTALTVNTGTLTLTANAANTSVLTIGAGAVSVSGSNTGDQTITLTGAVTGSGTGSFATTIATPGTLTVSSTNSTATAHTHAITSSSTPGAAASILATDSSGILGSTGTRIVKIWATDFEVTNAPTSGGVVIPTISSTNTLTNKRITKRVLALSANSATPAINTDSYDVVHITSQTTAITSFTSSLTGTPVDGDTLRISVTGTGAVALTFGGSFEASTVALPTTTVSTTRLDMGFLWNTETTKWRCVAVA